MEFYEAVGKRRTVRNWQKKEVSADILKRILSAGLKAPTNNHLREWSFVVLKDEKENALQFVKEWEAEKSVSDRLSVFEEGSLRKQMYSYAIPRQFSMLSDAPYVVIPLFKIGSIKAEHINELNSFASVWCVVENIFLAAAAEGLGCAVRIPVGEEERHVLSALEVPKDYRMPCYIGIGYPEEDEYCPQQIIREIEDSLHFEKW